MTQLKSVLAKLKSSSNTYMYIWWTLPTYRLSLLSGSCARRQNLKKCAAHGGRVKSYKCTYGICICAALHHNITVVHIQQPSFNSQWDDCHVLSWAARASPCRPMSQNVTSDYGPWPSALMHAMRRWPASCTHWVFLYVCTHVSCHTHMLNAAQNYLLFRSTAVT